MKRLLLAVMIILAPVVALAQGKTHYVAIHVDQNDPKVMNLALNNAQNVDSYYKSIGEEVVIELVTYGPGLNMLIPGKSPVESRISTMSLEMDNITFAACGNTRRKMSEAAGKEIEIMDEATEVTSGVVRLIELQEQGYAYVRP